MHLRGDRALEEHAGDGTLTRAPLDSFQTNPGVAQRLWASLASDDFTQPSGRRVWISAVEGCQPERSRE